MFVNRIYFYVVKEACVITKLTALLSSILYQVLFSFLEKRQCHLILACDEEMQLIVSRLNEARRKTVLFCRAVLHK